MSESVAAQYEKLIGEFRTLRKQYESQVVTYEAKLAAYNNEVEEWNRKGGAPKPVVDELNETREDLANERRELVFSAETLNALVAKLNAIGARGNLLVSDYNSIVKEYNERFAEATEFTQGDFTGESINIYQFNSEDELTVVLAHEFGHALALEHVENEESIMYHHMGAQRREAGITKEDEAEFKRVCDGVSPFVKLLRFVRSLV